VIFTVVATVTAIVGIVKAGKMGAGQRRFQTGWINVEGALKTGGTLVSDHIAAGA
jgi:hypothetical protein